MVVIINEQMNQRTQIPYIRKPKYQLHLKNKSRNPNITLYKKKKKKALAAHPQIFPALHPKIDLQLIKLNTTVTV